MTLTEIVDLCEKEYGNRFQVKRSDVIKLLDQIQKIAFNRDMAAFLQWGVYLTVYRTIDFISTGYTSAVSGDIGLPVVGVTSGATGTLISYDNTERRWVVNVSSGTFAVNEQVNITGGTGEGQLVAADAELGYIGPYAFPTTIPVRKLLGLTKVTDRQYFGDRMGTDEAYDYGLLLNYFDERKEFAAGRIDIFGRTFTFIEPPVTDAETYRWIYYRRAPTITGTDSANEANLLIPEEFHFTSLVQGVGALSDNLTYGDKTPEEVLEPYLQPFWTTITELSTGIGENSLGLSEGQL
jgi:hypothetical protein